MKSRFLLPFISILLISFAAGIYGQGNDGTFHLIPDATLLQQWRIDAGQSGFFTGNRTDGTFGRGVFDARLGLSDRVNVDLGYGNGASVALSAGILHERQGIVPSVTIGFSNVFNNSEAFLFRHDSGVWKSECFMALGKSIPALGMRLDGGVEAMPDAALERPAGFIGIEQRIVSWSSLSLEALYRDSRLQPSLFANAWFFGKRIELSLGAIDMRSMLLNNAGNFDIAFLSTARGGFVQPGVWAGLRFQGGLPRRTPGESYSSLKGRAEEQKHRIAALEHEADSLRTDLAQTTRQADSLHGSNAMARFQNGILENLTLLAALYGERNFDVEQARTLKKDIVNYGNLAVPELQSIALDKTYDGRIHAQAVILLCELGTQNAQDAILELLTQAHDPETVIEACIAAGKLQDRRTMSLLEKLAGDTNASVAFAATTALQQLK